MAPSSCNARIPGARPLDGPEHHEAPRSRPLLGGFYLEGRGAGFVLGKLIHIKNNTTSKCLVVRDLVLSAFRAIQWLIERPLFMDSTEVYLARRARVDVETLTKQSRIHLKRVNKEMEDSCPQCCWRTRPESVTCAQCRIVYPINKTYCRVTGWGVVFFLCSSRCWRAFIATF